MNNYWAAFCLTVLTELAVLVALLKFGATKSQFGWLILFVLGLNFITHSIAWTLRSYLGTEYWTLELAVVVVEAVALSRLPNWSLAKAFMFSLTLNAISIVVGGFVFTA